MRYPKFKNEYYEPLTIDNFIGYNTVDDPTSLPPGYLVSGSKNIDLSRKRGSLPKRLGMQRLITDAIDSYSTLANSTLILSSSNPIGQTITVSADCTAIPKIKVALTYTTVINEKIILTLWDSPSKSTKLGEAELVYLSGNAYMAYFHPVVLVTPSTQYYFELTHNGDGDNNVSVKCSTSGVYTGGNAYENGILKENYDLWFYVYRLALGAGAVEGLHAFQKSSGDIPLFSHGTSLYKLSGTEQSIAKTSTADFDDGTKDSNVLTASDKLTLAITGAGIVAVDNWVNEQYLDDPTFDDNPGIGQTFAYEYTLIEKIEVSFDDDGTASSADIITLSLYQDVTKATLLGTATTNYSRGTRTFSFAAPITVTPGTLYFELKNDDASNVEIQASSLNPYPDGQMYEGNTHPVINYDLQFRVYGGDNYYVDGKWTSPIYDLESTPLTAAVAWNATTPAGSQIIMKARGSHDGVNFGDWQNVLLSGAGIPRTRFVQVQITLDTDGSANPSLNDFTISWTTAYDTATAIKTGLTGNKVRFCDYQDDCYFTDGGRPQRYDGTNVRNVGIDPPSSAPTIAANAAAGNPNGSYKARVTFINGYGAESNGGAETGSLSVTSKQIDWTNVPLGPAGTTKRGLYRTKAGGSVYYFVHYIEDNTTTTYLDNTADSALVIPLSSTNNIPPNCSMIYEHKNYMLYIEGNKIYYSKAGLPDSVAMDYEPFKEFPSNITGVQTYQDALVVEGKTFSAVVYGDVWDWQKDPDTGEYIIDDTFVKIINKTNGAVSHEAMAKCDTSMGDLLVYPTPYGLSYLDPGQQDDTLRNTALSEEVQNIFDDAVNRENMAAIYNNYLYLLAMNYYGEDMPIQTNNIIMIYDFRKKVWYPPLTIGVSGFCIANGMLLAGSATAGIIYQLNSGSTDAGSKIHAVAITSKIAPQGNNDKTIFNNVRLAVTGESDTDTLQVTPIIDEVESSPINIGAKTGTTSPRFKLPSQVGYELQLKFDDDSTNDWVITRAIVGIERGVE